MRTWGFRLVAVLIGLAIGLVIVEVLVRTAAAQVTTRRPLDEGLPVLQEPDPELGWRNKAGRAVWPGLGVDGGKDITMTFWPGGLRATAPTLTRDRPEVVLIGGSYTQGWAVTDEETYPWLLQKEFPSHTFLNYGTAGYGTYQALLSLERHFILTQHPPDVVVYGFIDHHETRNVAPSDWLRALATASRAGPLRTPYVTLGADGQLERHQLDGTPSWPLRSTFASVALEEDRVFDFRTRARADQRRPATEALLEELQQRTRDHGAHLLVAILESRDEIRTHYLTWLKSRSIEGVDCTVPNQEQLQVPGYSHPDRRINALWARCVADRLKDRLR